MLGNKRASLQVPLQMPVLASDDEPRSVSARAEAGKMMTFSADEIHHLTADAPNLSSATSLSSSTSSSSSSSSPSTTTTTTTTASGGGGGGGGTATGGGGGGGDGKRLFDCVLVVGLNTKATTTERHPPYVTYHFPYPPSFMKAVTQFCFPDTNLDKMKKEEIFSFVLTEGNGEKRWGYCHRLFPQCFCIVSYLPCFSIFHKILKKVIKLHQSAPPTMPFSTCTVFLRAIYEQPLPPPGGTLHFLVEYPASGGKKAKTEAYAFRRPDDSDSLLDHVNFRPLLSLLSTENILATFASLLVERRLIFISERVSILSACVQASVAMLYPFSWQHVFIPVLPQSLLSFCCAPMPFVVGVLRSSVEELKSLSRNMEEVVIIDLDDDRVIPPGTQSDAALLPPFVEPLRATIDDIAKRARGGRVTLTGLANTKKRKLPKESTNALVNAFIGFMVDLLSSYRNYIVTTPTGLDEDADSEEPFIDFRRNDFLNDAPKEARPLLELVTETQMFTMFIEQRASSTKPNNGVFEQGVDDKAPTPSGPPDASNTSGVQGSNDTPAQKAPPRMRPAHTRFTMYEYGNITRSEISAVHEMIRDNAEKSKKDIEEQESLELLRKWREEEKRRKEEEKARLHSTTDGTRAPPERKKSLLEIVGRYPPSPPSSGDSADSEERARARGEAFLSIRVNSLESSASGQRQSFLAASRIVSSPEPGASAHSKWKRASISPGSPTPTSPTRNNSDTASDWSSGLNSSGSHMSRYHSSYSLRSFLPASGAPLARGNSFRIMSHHNHDGKRRDEEAEESDSAESTPRDAYADSDASDSAALDTRGQQKEE